MGLITPKRLKENEEFIWRLTDRQLDYILPRGTAELMADFAQPYTLLIIADLLGVPEEDHDMLLARRGMTQMPGTKPGVVSEHKRPASTQATTRWRSSTTTSPRRSPSAGSSRSMTC